MVVIELTSGRAALRTSEEELGHRMEADYWQKQHNMDLILKDQRMAKRYEAYDLGRVVDEETVSPRVHMRYVNYTTDRPIASHVCLSACTGLGSRRAEGCHCEAAVELAPRTLP